MRKNATNHSNLFLPLERTPKYEWMEGITKGFVFAENEFVKGVFGFDTETKGLDPYSNNAYMISFALSPKNLNTHVEIINFNQTFDERRAVGLDILCDLVQNPKVTLIGHNIKFDLKWLVVKYGWEIKCQVFDTMFASYLLNENQPAGLDTCMEIYLNQRSYKGMVNTGDLESEHVDDVLLYNALDAQTEVKLYHQMIPMLAREGCLRLAALANQVYPILVKMETRGVAIDVEYANKTKQKLIADCVAAKVTLKNMYGAFNPDSDKDLRDLLYKQLRLSPTKYTESGNASVDAEAINDLYEQTDDADHINFLDNFLPYTKKMKLLSTYYQPITRWLEYDGYVHTNYSLGKQYDGGSGGTVTGRMSSTNPNLQNIPRGKEHRGMFIPRQGYAFVDGDFSQLELRVVAYLSQEPVMIEAFENGWDIHTSVMADILGYDYDELLKLLEDRSNPKYQELKDMRVAIKRINFGIVYGVGAGRLQRLLKNELKVNKDLIWCQNLIDTWLGKYKAVANWLKMQRELADHHKYVRMAFGQRRRLPDAKDWRSCTTTEEKQLAARAQRQATNFPVQSLASWIMLLGMVLVDQYFQDEKELDAHILLQVHDSMTCEIRKPFSRKENNENRLLQISRDIQHIMEKDTIRFMKEYFGLAFNVPLSFPTKILDRWE